MMKTFNPSAQDLFLFFFCMLSLISTAQTPHAATDTTNNKPKRFDYSYLKDYAESDTKIFGKVNTTAYLSQTQLYPKGELFGDTFYYIKTGAVVEVLNTDLPLNKTSHRMLVKVISDPAKKQYAGKVGWMLIDHTDLMQFLDEDNKRIDTNRVRNKYLSGATKLRDEAQKTTCPENKKCKLEWAAYYDCMGKWPHYDTPANCPLANCELKECPGDQ
jgi:hypothetical protein